MIVDSRGNGFMDNGFRFDNFSRLWYFRLL